MSVRRGIRRHPSVVRGIGHEVDEAVEEVRGVVRAGRGLRVVLHRERRQVERPQTLHDVVVEVDVADHDPAVAAAVVRRDGLAVEGRVHREAVVVRGDLDLAGGAVHHRLVHAAVAVAQLVGAVAERAAEQLVAVADAEERDPAVQHLAQQVDLVRRRRRVARTVGEEDAVRRGGQDVVDGRVRRQDVDADPALGEALRRHRLDAEVDAAGDGRDVLRRPARPRRRRRWTPRRPGRRRPSRARPGRRRAARRRGAARRSRPAGRRPRRCRRASRRARAGGGSARGCRSR